MSLSLKLEEKNKNWIENNHNHRIMKDVATKADTKSKEKDYQNTVFSDLTFTVAAAPAQVQSQYGAATSSIPYDPTIKGIFAAAGAKIQVSESATTSDTYNVTLEIPKSQVVTMP